MGHGDLAEAIGVGQNQRATLRIVDRLISELLHDV